VALKAYAAWKTLATELVETTSTINVPAVKADRLRSLKKCHVGVGRKRSLSNFDLALSPPARYSAGSGSPASRAGVAVNIWANCFARQIAVPLPMVGTTIDHVTKADWSVYWVHSHPRPRTGCCKTRRTGSF
jgi:hypothetical protein